MVVRREMSFMKKMSLIEPKKNGVYKIKCGSRKKWTTIGLRGKKNWGKVRKIGYLEYKTKNEI